MKERDGTMQRKAVDNNPANNGMWVYAFPSRDRYCWSGSSGRHAELLSSLPG